MTRLTSFILLSLLVFTAQADAATCLDKSGKPIAATTEDGSFVLLKSIDRVPQGSYSPSPITGKFSADVLSFYDNVIEDLEIARLILRPTNPGSISIEIYQDSRPSFTLLRQTIYCK